MNLFFPIIGFVLGFVFSVTMVSGAVWCVQMTISRGWLTGMAAGLGISLAQVIWSVLAALIVWWLARYSSGFDWLFRLGAAFVLGYMSLTIYQSPRFKTIQYDGPLTGAFRVLWTTFGLALAMPMRLIGYSSLLIAVSLHLRERPTEYAVLLALGVGLGSMAWWLYFTVLAALFGKRVPEEISVHSMNKLRFLGGTIFLILLFICTAPLVPGFNLD